MYTRRNGQATAKLTWVYAYTELVYLTEDSYPSLIGSGVEQKKKVDRDYNTLPTLSETSTLVN